MKPSTSSTARLLGDVAEFISGREGTVGVKTPIDRLTIWVSTTPTQPTAAVFEPMFYAVLQGTKVLLMGANRFELTAGNCAASSSGLPFIHQFIEATPETPYVAVSLHLDIDLLARVMLDMPKTDERWSCAVAAAALGDLLADPLSRLVGLLSNPGDIGMLAPHYETELYYRLLQSPMADTLRQVGQRNGRFQQLKAAADWLATNYDEPVDIPSLAATAGMSVTSFHRHFKGVTGFSPLAFQRHVRLLEARKLLAAGSTTVANVAYEVGYMSASQFSREYKTMFGSSPVRDLER